MAFLASRLLAPLKPIQRCCLGASIAFWGALMTPLLAPVRVQQPEYLCDEFWVPRPQRGPRVTLLFCCSHQHQEGNALQPSSETSLQKCDVSWN